MVANLFSAIKETSKEKSCNDFIDKCFTEDQIKMVVISFYNKTDESFEFIYRPSEKSYFLKTHPKGRNFRKILKKWKNF